METFEKLWLLYTTVLVFYVSRSRCEKYNVTEKSCQSIKLKDMSVIAINEKISCCHGNKLAKEIIYKFVDMSKPRTLLDVYPFTCIVVDKNSTVLDSYNDSITNYKCCEKGGSFSQLDLEVPSKLVLIAEVYAPNSTICYYMEITIIEENCENTPAPVEIDESPESFIKHQCDMDLVLDISTPGFAACYNVTWFGNEAPLSESFWEIKRKTTRLKIPASDIRHTKYSCEVSLHGRVILKKQYDVCVTGGKFDNDIIFKESSPHVEAKLGSTVKLICNGTGGLRTSVEWIKTSESSDDLTLCHPQASVSGWGKSSYVRDINCKIVTHDVNSNSTCKTPDTCKKKFTGTFVSTLEISDLKKEDLGTYKCIAITTREPIARTITLTEAPSPPQITLVLVILALVTITVLAFLVGCLVKYLYKVELQLFWKKYAANFDSDDRSFAAFLSYCYNNESQEEIKELLQKLHKWFELKTYFVFDQHRYNAADLRYNLIHEVVPNCHRMVIVLTPSYIMNEATGFDTNSGIQSYIEGNVRLVFIVTPLFRDYFCRQLELGDPICRAIKMAMGQKLNSVIYWKKKSQDKFFKALEVAMPKLRAGSFISSKQSSMESMENARIPLNCEREVSVREEGSSFI